MQIYLPRLPKEKPVGVTGEEFERYFEARVQKCRETLIQKAKEYASDSDKMRNFNVVGRMLNIPPEQVAFHFMMKHFESLYEIIFNEREVSEQMWDEKVGDLLNYWFLIDAMWKKRRGLSP